MQELHAGYVSAALWEKILRKGLSADIDWRAILRGLSHFVIDKELQPIGELDPVVAVLDNLLARGLPTLPSLFVEQALASRTGLIKVEKTGKADTQAYEVSFTADFVDLRADLERALCVYAHNAKKELSGRLDLLQVNTANAVAAVQSIQSRLDLLEVNQGNALKLAVNELKTEVSEAKEEVAGGMTRLLVIQLTSCVLLLGASGVILWLLLAK